MPFTPDKISGFVPDEPMGPPNPTLGDKISNVVSSKIGPENTELLKNLGGAATSFAGGGGEGLSLGNIPQEGFVKEQMQQHPTAATIGKFVGGAIPGAIIGGLTGGLAPAGAGLGAAAARIGANTAGGALQGYLSKPDEGGSRSDQAIGGAALGGGLSTLGEGISAAGRPIADWLMKKAVGIGRAPSGVGNSLIDQGLIGTQNRMLEQTQAKLPKVEADLQELVGQLKGNIDPAEIQQAVSQHAGRFITPEGGKTLSLVQPDLNKVRGVSEEVGNLGPISPKDALNLKRQGDWAGYTASGTPASATDASLGRTIADKMRSGLSTLSEGQGSAVPETLKKEQALILAKKSLDKDPATGAALINYLTTGRLPAQGIVGSTAAQLTQKGSNLAGGLASPAALQALLAGANASEK